MSFAVSHASFEARLPDYKANEQELERQRIAAGMNSTREFPCRGFLRETGQGRTLRFLMCDRCRFEVAVKVDPVETPDDSTSEEW